jgi:hypothetical protein
VCLKNDAGEHKVEECDNEEINALIVKKTIKVVVQSAEFIKLNWMKKLK